MAYPTQQNHKPIEQTQIIPSSSTSTTTTISLPLTFLDLPLAGPIYVRRQFFYHFPHSTNHFRKTTLPSLKHSLSLTLQHFFPLAGNLISPPPPHKPFILCTQKDSVTFTVIETSANFNHLSANHHPKNLKDYNHLVPKLTHKTTYDDNDIENNTFIFPLLALQASVFPNHGLCIAITYCHVMDDSCCSHFMKSWSFIHRNCEAVDLKSTPCFDRNFFRDTKGLENVFLRDYFEERKTWKDKLIAQTQSQISEEEYVKATIVFAKEEIERMKIWALNQWKKIWALNQWKKNDHEVQAPQLLSKFVVTCGFIWASLVKARYRNDDDDDDEKEEYFRFAGDCRDRLGYKIPKGYFGNCLTLCHATVKRKVMKGEDGFVNAVKVIERAISEMKNEPFKDVGEWSDTFKKMYLGSVLLVTGSPKFNVYETDFGFGKPVKVEMVHSFKCMSIAESGDREGGLEVGLVFKSGEFEYFCAVIEQGLEALKC